MLYLYDGGWCYTVRFDLMMPVGSPRGREDAAMEKETMRIVGILKCDAMRYVVVDVEQCLFLPIHGVCIREYAFGLVRCHKWSPNSVLR